MNRWPWLLPPTAAWIGWMLVAVMLGTIVASTGYAQEEFFMPVEQFARFKNRADANGSGSCVQASMSIAGAHHGVPAAEYLLHGHPDYGPAVLGGSWPERVERYCKERSIPIYNIEGSQSIEYICWALDNGAYAVITYGHAHMINAIGISPDHQTFWIIDNNYPREIRQVSRQTFISEHRSFAGGWCVLLKTFGPPPWELPEPRLPADSNFERGGIDK